MAKDVPLSCQQRLPYELLSSLANSLLDGTVIDIVRGLKDIQMMEEQSLMETRRTVLKSQAETKAELVRRQREQKEALLLAGGQSPDFIDMAQEKETKVLDQMHKEELTRVDMKIITQLDQLVSEQQVVLEKAGVPGFFVTNSPMEISIQMQLLMFITKTWFDWKCNVRSKARSASGKKALSPLEERLIAITGLLDSDDAPLARKDVLPCAEVVYEVDDSSFAAYVDGAASRTEASDSAEPVSDLVQSGYGESHGEYIVPTSETSASGSGTVVQARPAGTASGGGPPLVLSDVRSLASGPHTAVSVKQEMVDADDVDEEDDSDSDSEVDDNESQQAPAAEDRSPRFCWTQREDRPPGRSSDVAGHSTPPGKSGRKRPSAEDLKARFEFQIFSATKRKLEADERRADAEAQFYRQEVKRSMTLASLHVEERRKIAAVADFHAEERRKAAAKVEMLLEHKKFYIEQQKTEVLKRRLLQLEIKRIKRDLGDTGGAK